MPIKHTPGSCELKTYCELDESTVNLVELPMTKCNLIARARVSDFILKLIRL